MNTGTVVVERVFDADIQLVWRAISEKELMKLWYFDLAEFKLEVGFKFEVLGGPEDGVQYNHLCEITEVIIEKKLSYTWKFEGFAGDSLVTFDLSEEGTQTKLRVTHSGIDTFPAEVQDFAVHNFEIGWNNLLSKSLQDFLDNNK